jgi:hypothetical protein
MIPVAGVEVGDGPDGSGAFQKSGESHLEPTRLSTIVTLLESERVDENYFRNVR